MHVKITATALFDVDNTLEELNANHGALAFEELDCLMRAVASGGEVSESICTAVLAE